jgi:uncharacterized protein YndB with AHSA1/START domain
MNQLITAATLVVVVTASTPAHAERPPPRGRAAPALLAGDVVDPGTAGACFLSSLPAERRAEFERHGQVLLEQPGSGSAGTIRAVLRFDRPRDEVFAILSRPSEQSRYLPNVTQSKTVGARTAEGERTDLVVSVLFTIAFRTQSWFYPEEHRIEWTLDPTGADGLTAQEGFFQLYALDERTTLAEYETRVVARSGLLEFFRSLGAKGGVADALAATRRHVATAKP